MIDNEIEKQMRELEENNNYYVVMLLTIKPDSSTVLEATTINQNTGLLELTDNTDKFLQYSTKEKAVKDFLKIIN